MASGQADLTRSGTLGVVLATGLVFAGCGSGSSGDPLERTLREVARLCRTDDLGTGAERGCRSYADHGGWRGRALVTIDDERGTRVSVALAGGVREVDEMRARAEAIVAPLLDSRQRDAVAQRLRDLYRATDHDVGAPETPEVRVGGASIHAFSGVDVAAPWRRFVGLSLSVAPHGASAGSDGAEPGERRGLGPSFGVARDDVIAAWRALCLDDAAIDEMLGYRAMGADEVEEIFSDGDRSVPTDRWTAGDFWIRCSVLHGDKRSVAYAVPLLFDVTWDPVTRSVVYLRVMASDAVRAGGALAVLDRVLGPLMDPDRRACVLRRVREDDAPTCDGVRIDRSPGDAEMKVEIKLTGNAG